MFPRLMVSDATQLDINNHGPMLTSWVPVAGGDVGGIFVAHFDPALYLLRIV